MKLKQMMARLKRFEGHNESNLKTESIKRIGSQNSSRVKNKGCFGQSKTEKAYRKKAEHEIRSLKQKGIYNDRFIFLVKNYINKNNKHLIMH